MSTKATGNFKIERWEEQPYLENEDGGKLTRAKVEQTFHGKIDGHGEVEWLMCYRPDNTADFVGLQRIVGRVGEHSGSIVLESTGTFDGSQAKGPVRVVPGSGTGELKGVSGEGELHAPLGSQPSLTLKYHFD
jgi:hypothetical protein